MKDKEIDIEDRFNELEKEILKTVDKKVLQEFCKIKSEMELEGVVFTDYM